MVDQWRVLGADVGHHGVMARATDDPDGERLWWVLGADHPKRVTRSSSSGSVLAAAMIAVGEILEPGNVRVEIQEEASMENDDLLSTLHFGDLPPFS